MNWFKVMLVKVQSLLGLAAQAVDTVEETFDDGVDLVEDTIEDLQEVVEDILDGESTVSKGE